MGIILQHDLFLLYEFLFYFWMFVLTFFGFYFCLFFFCLLWVLSYNQWYVGLLCLCDSQSSPPFDVGNGAQLSKNGKHREEKHSAATLSFLSSGLYFFIFFLFFMLFFLLVLNNLFFFSISDWRFFFPWFLFSTLR